MPIDYNKVAKTYDLTRKSAESIIDIFNRKVRLLNEKNILDFGCGTGNYLFDLIKKFPANYYGLEPSEGMRSIAKKKNPAVIIREGDHTNIPFADEFFDFIFLTDVIHHIPDLNCLFDLLCKKIKYDGIICILTSSHEQIETRWYNKYFPSLSNNEKRRYPDIDQIIHCAQKNGLSLKEVELINPGNRNIVTKEFIKMVEQKNYSMFQLLNENEYQKGLESMKLDIGKEITGEVYETLVWLTKNILKI